MGQFCLMANAPYFPGVGGGEVGVYIDKCINLSWHWKIMIRQDKVR